MPKLSFLLFALAALYTQQLIAQPPARSSAPSNAASASSPVQQPLPPGGEILDRYIRLGLDSNLALHQRNFDWQKARIGLQRARAQFYPQLALNSQYTLADGGRSIGIPIGDLLNGVYSSLNQLTNSNKFPRVSNESVQFLPNNYQDSKLEVTLPLINTDLLHNKEVSRESITSSQADRDIYRRDLVRSIRQAYYQYLQAGKAADIYLSALTLVKENRRVSEKLVENNMATRETVLRSQSQVSQVESSLIEAGNNVRNAAAYFNFLLNRPLDEPVLVDPTIMTDIPDAPIAGGADATRSHTDVDILLFSREEFTRLSSWQRIQQSNLHWNKNYWVPRLNAFYDVGFQGYGYHFDGSQFYQMAGVQMVWSLFKGNDNKYKIRQAEIDIASVGDQYRQLAQQVSLESTTALNNYSSAAEALHSLSDEVASSREAYRLSEKRFKEGQALQVELIDARSQMTSAEIRYSLGRLAVLNRAADLERVMATYKF